MSSCAFLSKHTNWNCVDIINLFYVVGLSTSVNYFHSFSMTSIIVWCFFVRHFIHSITSLSDYYDVFLGAYEQVLAV